MATKWVVTTPSDRIDLDETQQGQTTFTVTNPASKVDRVVFDIVPGDGADASWFTVDEPQRRVPASGSVSYLMKTSIPPTAKAGSYSVQGRAYSADSAPEEDSVLSSRLAVDIKAKAAPENKKFPWWIVVVAALVVIVLVVVGILIFGGSDTEQVTAPDLTRQSEAQAKTNLGVFGLTVGKIRHKQDATPDNVLYQSVPGGTKVDKGSPVDLVITVALAVPTVTAPAAGTGVPAKSVAPQITPVPGAAPSPSGSAKPTATPTSTVTTTPGQDVLRWTDSDKFVSRWQVVIQQQSCPQLINVPFSLPRQPCYFLTSQVVQVDRPSYTPILVLGGRSTLQFLVTDLAPAFQWSVAPIDDFGNLGPASPFIPFVVQ